MQARRRTNVLLGLVVLAVALIPLLRALDTFPEGLDDLIQRAWPVLLIFGGLVLLLRDRLPASNVLALLASGLLLAGVTQVAYTSREGEQRSDQQVLIDEEFDRGVVLLVVNLNLLETDLDVRTADSNNRELSGEFVGSLQSEIDFACISSEVGITECTLNERKTGQWPLLEAIGRGSLSLVLPTDVPVALAFAGEDGNATFNLNEAQLERIAVDLRQGDVLLTTPSYQPQSPSAADDPGEIIVRDGDLTIVVPANVNARLVFDRRGSDISPQFPPAYIEQRDGVDGVLRRDDEDGDFNLNYDVIIPQGLLRLDISEAG